MIRLEHLTIRYGQRTAVDDLSCEFATGAVGLLGRNGAGKSSILKTLLGLVVPSAGRVVVDGLPADADPAQLRAHIGYMPEREAYLPQTTGFDMVALLARLSGMPTQLALRRAHEVLYLVGLEEQRYREIAGYSTGMRQKAKLAAALVHDPAVVLLDEPTNGLDPEGRADMLGLIRQLCRELGKSVVLSTHIMQDVESTCRDVVVLEAGRVVAHGPLATLVAGAPAEFVLDVRPATPAVLAGLEALGALRRQERGGWLLRLQPGVASAQVFAVVQAAGGVVRTWSPQRRSLEDVFLQAVAPAGRGGRRG